MIIITPAQPYRNHPESRRPVYSGKSSPPAPTSWCSATKCTNISSTTGSHTKACCAILTLWERSLVLIPSARLFHNIIRLEDRLPPGARSPDCGVPKVHQFNVFSVNFMQYAPGDYLLDPETYLGLNAFTSKERLFFLDMRGSCLRPST